MMRDVINLTAPSHYALELGKQFSGIVASWDLEQRFCPTGRFTPDGHCRVAGNVSAVAAACDAQPACSGRALGPGSGGAAAAPPAGKGRRARARARGAPLTQRSVPGARRFVFSAPNNQTPSGLLKSGLMDPYCLVPSPQSATLYRLNASAAPRLPAPVRAVRPPEAGSSAGAAAPRRRKPLRGRRHAAGAAAGGRAGAAGPGGRAAVPLPGAGHRAGRGRLCVPAGHGGAAVLVVPRALARARRRALLLAQAVRRQPGARPQRRLNPAQGATPARPPARSGLTAAGSHAARARGLPAARRRLWAAA